MTNKIKCYYIYKDGLCVTNSVLKQGKIKIKIRAKSYPDLELENLDQILEHGFYYHEGNV